MVARPRRVGISGSYGGINLGDEAILHAIVAQLRASLDVEITVFSRCAADTRARHQVDRVVEPSSLSRRESGEVIGGLDLFVLGGGGILFDGDADAYLRELELAQELAVPSMVYAISAGPLTTPSTRRHVRDVLGHADVVTVRDRASRRLLEEIGIEREITVTADPALLLEREPLTVDEILRAEALDPEACLVAFSVREPGPAAPDVDVEHHHRLVANAADFVIDRLGAEAVFFPLERRTLDVQHSHGVIAQMRHASRATVLKREYTPGQILSVLSHFELAIGMRLHFLIFSALADLAFVALPYASKVRALLDDLGLEGPAMERVSAGQLIAHVDRVWDNREAQRAKVRAALPALTERARRNHALALELLSRPRRRQPPRGRGERARA